MTAINPRSDWVEVPGKVLANAGMALFGPAWQSDLARLLKLERRTIQRWAAAASADQGYSVSPRVLADLMSELDRKHMPLERAIEDLKLFYDRAS